MFRKNEWIINQLRFKILIILTLLLVSHAYGNSASEEEKVLPSSAVTPFGANLFSGNFSSQQQNGLDPNYIIVPGDTISLHIWGAIQADETVSVDAQGNIFLPDVGAVKVAGSPANQLPALVRQKLETVFKDGVDVYVNLITSTPINVFVTGYVKNPGQYSGMQTDSILSFLHRAGGIIEKEGSYRKIRILRKKSIITTVDLYSFLRWGDLPNINFKSGDTILVAPQNATISVSGDTRGKYIFELKNSTATGRDLIEITNPRSSVTNVSLKGTRNRNPVSINMELHSFSKTILRDGDTVDFITDSRPSTVDIKVTGSHLGKSFFTAKKGTRLRELLDYVAVSPDEANISNIYILRKSVALKQKKNLDDSINRLEQSILNSPAKSSSEVAIRQQESVLLNQFINNARKIVPEGRIVVSGKNGTANIRLEDGDIIVIPSISDIVTVSGEVNAPQALVYSQNYSIDDFIARSGGFTNRGDRDKVIIRKPNGRISYAKETTIEAGDEILVYPKIDTKSLQFTKDIATIIFQIAAASKAVGIL